MAEDATAEKCPCLPTVRGLEHTHTPVFICTIVRLACANVERIIRHICGIERERTDRE